MIAKDEADRIERSLKAVQFSDDIVVIIDSRTTDSTEQITRKFTKNIFVRTFDGYGKTRQFAISKTKHKWVLWIDADEVVTKDLQSSILRLSENSPAEAFRISIMSEYMFRWMDSVWSPKRDRHPRLFDKTKVRFDNKKVHEKLVFNGDAPVLGGLIEHYTFRNNDQIVDKVQSYSTLRAQELFESGVRFHWWQLIYYPLYSLVRSYVRWGSYKDGTRGFILTVYFVFNVFLDYVKLWELEEFQKRK